METGHITAKLVRRLVDSQFPQWSSLPIRPVARQGVDNRSFRLGEDLLVRLPFGDWYAHQVAKEQTWLPRLGRHLPLPIPEPVAQGAPAAGYPYAWSVYRWIDGDTAADTVTDWRPVAESLGRFLAVLHSLDARGGPKPGVHNFFRGAPVSVYRHEVSGALSTLGEGVDRDGAHAVWAAATGSSWTRRPCWFHGDVSAENLLVRNGRLCAVIDFGASGIGDPACDTVLAWTHLDPASRSVFRQRLGLDTATWARGRGWALWKSLITLVHQLEDNNLHAAATTRSTIGRIIADHRAELQH